MLVLKWSAEHECKKHILADGINARIHLVKGGSFQFPETVEKVVRKQFSDALNCGYCAIEQASGKKKSGGNKPEEPKEEFIEDNEFETIEEDK